MTLIFFCYTYTGSNKIVVNYFGINVLIFLSLKCYQVDLIYHFAWNIQEENEFIDIRISSYKNN